MTSPSDPVSNSGSSSKNHPSIKDGAMLGGAPDTKTIVGAESVTGDPPSKSAVPIGGMIGKYQIRAQLGSGGMGAVYLAFDPMIEREVAIKVLTQEVGASSVALQRFLQEARAIGRLSHPNVVSIFDIDQWNGQYYLVMELLTGGSLAEIVDANGPLPWRDACAVIAQAGAGLAAAHDADMVHRDIKPENLMQSKDGIVKVVDFGLSKLVDAANDTRTAVTKQGQILGTPHYMSPEQFEATEIDFRTDIYSLGASLFRLLTGRFPYDDCATIVQTMMAHLNKPVPPASAINPQVPEECDRIIARAMAKRPSERYQNARALADDLIDVIRRFDTQTTNSDSPQPHGGSVAVDADDCSRIVEPAGPLKSVVIVEPSKMLASMTKDAVHRAGASQVRIFASMNDASKAMQSHPPDLLITAMQLPDGRGIDLISSHCGQPQFRHTCVVLNSSDSTIADLIGAGDAPSRILAPKRVRPDDVLRVVHAAGSCPIAQGPLSAPLDPMNLRLLIFSESNQIPDSLAELIRTAGLLDVTIAASAGAGSIPTDGIPTLVLRIWSAKRMAGDDLIYTKIADWVPDSMHLRADVLWDGRTLLLRSVFRQGVIASVCQLLDANRLKSLLQACQSA